MFHWLYDPHRKIKRFAEENIKAKPRPVKDLKISHILEMASKHGMKTSDIDSLAEELKAENLITARNNHERYKNMKYMMSLLLDDLNLDAAEKDFLKEFGVEIGYPVEKIPYLIREMYNGMKNEESESEIEHAVEEVLVH